MSIATINATLQLLDIYIYIYRERERERERKRERDWFELHMV